MSPSPLLSGLLIALNLVVLHRSDGGNVTINAEQVTTLRAPAGKLGHLAPGGHCIIGLTDGRFVAVLEACETVKQRLEAR